MNKQDKQMTVSADSSIEELKVALSNIDLQIDQLISEKTRIQSIYEKKQIDVQTIRYIEDSELYDKVVYICTGNEDKRTEIVQLLEQKYIIKEVEVPFQVITYKLLPNTTMTLDLVPEGAIADKIWDTYDDMEDSPSFITIHNMADGSKEIIDGETTDLKWPMTYIINKEFFSCGHISRLRDYWEHYDDIRGYEGSLTCYRICDIRPLYYEAQPGDYDEYDDDHPVDSITIINMLTHSEK